MTYHFAVPRLGDHGALPERVRQWCKAQRRKERLAGFNDLHGVVVVVHQQFGQVVTRVGFGRAHQVVDVAPALCPHVAQQVRADRLVQRHDLVAILLVQTGANVALQLVVQRLDLVPQAVRFGGKLGRRQVVARTPHGAHIGKAQLARAFVGQRHHGGVVALHVAAVGSRMATGTSRHLVQISCRRSGSRTVPIISSRSLRGTCSPSSSILPVA